MAYVLNTEEEIEVPKERSQSISWSFFLCILQPEKVWKDFSTRSSWELFGVPHFDGVADILVVINSRVIHFIRATGSIHIKKAVSLPFTSGLYSTLNLPKRDWTEQLYPSIYSNILYDFLHSTKR